MTAGRSGAEAHAGPNDALHYALHAVSTVPTVSSAPRLARILSVAIDCLELAGIRGRTQKLPRVGETLMRNILICTLCRVSKPIWRKAESP